MRINSLVASTCTVLNWRAVLPSIKRLYETLSGDPTILWCNDKNKNIIGTVQRYDGNTARLARRSDEALECCQSNVTSSEFNCTEAIRLQSPAGSPDFRMWESCRTMPLAGGFSRGSPVSAAPYSLQSPSSALKTTQSPIQARRCSRASLTPPREEGGFSSPPYAPPPPPGTKGPPHQRRRNILEVELQQSFRPCLSTESALSCSRSRDDVKEHALWSTQFFGKSAKERGHRESTNPSDSPPLARSPRHACAKSGGFRVRGDIGVTGEVRGELQRHPPHQTNACLDKPIKTRITTYP
ncbi:hypothetical protein PR048_026218 [Dryococelus australis]|uniref:Uncharacterized protein n=1 Tax=Dryococelus australis TaxID=614101 RepID=A0ABQ9GKR3_9NEOP|nr:hypothetical protein PR048_026218 [Dryococelus australis]